MPISSQLRRTRPCADLAGGLLLCKKELGEKLDKAVFPGTQGGPLMHIIAAKAVALGEALRPDFRFYQENIIANAHALAEELQHQGLRLVSGGTDNHMMLVDLTSLSVTGKAAEVALDEVGIACNKNLIPFDPLPPRVTSGIRLGSPAATTRGFGMEEMREVARLIVQALRHLGEPEIQRHVRARTLALCSSFPPVP